MPIQIFCREFGKTITLHVDLADSVQKVKAQVELKSKVPVHMQRLIFAGKQLDDEQILSDVGISNESTIHLLTRIHLQ